MVIFDQDNEQIILRDGRYYLRSDVGHFVPEYLEIEISKEDAEKVRKDIKYAIKLVLDYQNKEVGTGLRGAFCIASFSRTMTYIWKG